MARRYWLFKSDPESFGVEHLEQSPDRTTMWDGVRNYQARNFLRDDVAEGDGVLFYHSQSKPPAVVATARVVRSAYPDPSQFDRRSKAHDPKSTPDEPRWFAVDIRLDRRFREAVALERLRKTRGLESMELLRKGSRLSIQPVTPAEWKIVLRLAGVGRGRDVG